MPNLNHPSAEQVRDALAAGLPPRKVQTLMTRHLQDLARPREEPGETDGLLTSPEEVSPSASENTSSEFSNTGKKRKCSGLRKDGQPCRAYALATGDLCIYHEDDRVTNFSDAQARGGSARRNAIDLESLAVNLHNPIEFHAFLETFLRMQLAGSIPDSTANRIIRTLRLIHGSFETVRYRADNKADRYSSSLEACLEATNEIADRLFHRDIAERTERIADVGSSRREYLRANQDFGHNQPRPTRTPSHPHSPFALPKFPNI
jgi:hypothetical protein